MQQATIFESIDNFNSMTIEEQVAALNAQVATYKDLPEGDYLNLYTMYGIGAVLGLYPKAVA